MEQTDRDWTICSNKKKIYRRNFHQLVAQLEKKFLLIYNKKNKQLN